MERYYYSGDIKDFVSSSSSSIFGQISGNSVSAQVSVQQKNAWQEETSILQRELKNMDGKILFEYTIPRMGKRVDAVILYKNIVFLLEFKCGASAYSKEAKNQVCNYALDLRDFHKESHDKLLVPILVATHAPSEKLVNREIDRILETISCNDRNIGETIRVIADRYTDEKRFDYSKWQESPYLPTPTIIEAAQALYQGHKVEDITRNDAGVINLAETTDQINSIISESKRKHRKSICFVTGVPGAGKTLVGLNLAIQHSNAEQGEHAVFLSGNFPLVQVLQEALARDKVEQQGELGVRVTKETARRAASEFIQIIHHYRDSYVGNKDVPPERIAIFDEAQRAWTHEQIEKFMRTKKNKDDFAYSEPEFLIQTMDRHQDWAVVICLVGGGQEINTGEAGLHEWFDSLRRSFPDWGVYLPPELNAPEYLRGADWNEMTAGLNTFEFDSLHLKSSIRSFRAMGMAAFVNKLLEGDAESAREHFGKIRDKYPIYITRDLVKAKKWLKDRARGQIRYGILASSGGLRLKHYGIFVKNDNNIVNWFLNSPEDVRSNCYLEDVASEFEVQGLELDYTMVAWDADFRYSLERCDWIYQNFIGTRWRNVKKEENRRYLKNAYRVLLTRARQGMVIYIPAGDSEDPTSHPDLYDETFNYLRSVGIPEI